MTQISSSTVRPGRSAASWSASSVAVRLPAARLLDGDHDVALRAAMRLQPGIELAGVIGTGPLRIQRAQGELSGGIVITTLPTFCPVSTYR
jgi:hypothetical protein